jgi:undecaprenyl-diphosphatase
VENLLQVILLGIIEGITEFLPISSTGHLLIAQHWLGARSELFTVAIQAGAILAVIAIYWQRLWQLTLNLAQPASRNYLFKLLTAFVITVIGGFAAKQMGLELPQNVAPVAWAMVIGGAAIFLIEAYAARQPASAEVTRIGSASHRFSPPCFRARRVPPPRCSPRCSQARRRGPRQRSFRSCSQSRRCSRRRRTKC